MSDTVVCYFGKMIHMFSHVYVAIVLFFFLVIQVFLFSASCYAINSIDSNSQDKVIASKDKFFDFDIDPQSLENALLKFSYITNYVIVVNPNNLTGKNTIGLKASLSIYEALDMLLSNSGLAYRKMGKSGFVIIKSVESDNHNEENYRFSSDKIIDYEEVFVRGLRVKQLKESLFKKNTENAIVDVVFSNGLGDFPGKNISESLLKVPGVMVRRARGGQGRFLSIRGLGESFNVVKYNGRLISSENGTRDLSFDILSSERIYRTEVTKTSSASSESGSISGQINMVPYKPLDEFDSDVLIKLGSIYEEKSSDHGLDFSGVIRNSWMDDHLGVLVFFSSSKEDFRVDVVESVDTFVANIYDVADVTDNNLRNELIGDDESSLQSFMTRDIPLGNNGELIPLVAQSRYNSTVFSTTTEKRERTNSSFALQIKPNDVTDIVIDAEYSRFKSPGETNISSHYPCIICVNDIRNVVIGENNILEQYEWDRWVEFGTRRTTTDLSTKLVGVNVTSKLYSNFELTADFSFSQTKGRRDKVSANAGAGEVFLVATLTDARHSFRYEGRQAPSTEVSINPYDEGLAFPNPDLPSISANETGNGYNPRIFRPHFSSISFNNINDQVSSVKIDSSWRFSADNRLKTGIFYHVRNKINDLYDNLDVPCYFCINQVSLRGLNPELFDNEVLGAPVSSFLNDSNANHPEQFVYFSIDGLRDLYTSVNQGDPIRDAEGNVIVGDDGLVTTHDFSILPTSNAEAIFTTSRRPEASNRIKESIVSLYGQWDTSGIWKGYPWTTEFGVRISRTNLLSEGVNSLTNRGENEQGNTVITFLSEFQDVSFKNNYIDFLPAFNAKLDLTDSLRIRLAASSTVARPSLDDLSTVFDLHGDRIGVNLFYVSGNPQLKPIRSRNIDIAFEWDLGRMQASLTNFYKRIDGYIENTVFSPQAELVTYFGGDIRVEQPENLGIIEIYGLEGYWRHHFNNGLGYQLNYSLMGSYREDEPNSSWRLENLSKYSYNISGFYESGPLTVSLVYHFRSDFVRDAVGLQGLAEVVDDYSQLDFFVDFKLTDQFSAYIEAKNVTGENEYIYFSGTPNLLRYYEERGARYNIGARIRF